MINLKSKSILIPGGNGFLGTFLVRHLKKLGCKNIFIPRSKDYDLVQMRFVKKVYDDAKPDIVIHLAAKVGGIGANRNNPGKFFYDNLLMGAQLMEIGRQKGIEKFVTIGTICSYPKFAPIPFKEEDIWKGYPDEINAPYGIAKKMLLVQSQSYRQQYGFNSINLILVNLYGPGDNFDLRTSHVIPALIKKCIDAQNKGTRKITVWGRGNSTREFIYIQDAVRGIVLATQEYNKSEPVNLGTGFEISIKELANLIIKLTGFKGEIVWDDDKPEGQPRRCVDTKKACKEFGFKAKTKFEDGLKKTISWYRENAQLYKDGRKVRSG